DGLQLEDGRWISVRAAAESLIEVTAEPTFLTRLAWHLGNRHLPARIEPHRILIRRDHVIADMLSKLGATLRFIEAPFTPEGGDPAGCGSAGGHRRGRGRVAEHRRDRARKRGAGRGVFIRDPNGLAASPARQSGPRAARRSDHALGRRGRNLRMPWYCTASDA